MEIKVDNVQAKVNAPKVNFDTMKLEEKEKELLKKKKIIIAASTALTIGAVVVSNALKLQKKIKKSRK
ncbi:MAG: hypothetical protein E7517_08525 [Ruminococcaceae bacterium]|nr:hypothetical protein [Oscillospiraceae bacterium]